jgi:hypothetical protein
VDKQVTGKTEHSVIRGRCPLMAFVLTLVAAITLAPAALAATVHNRTSQGGTTTWHLNRSVLDALDIHISAESSGLPSPSPAKRSSYSELKFDALDMTAFRFRESQGLPRALTGGALRHAGGFVLDFPGGRADLRGFVLRPSSHAPFALDVVDADNHVWFTLDHGHYQLEDANRTFALRYMNLRISPHFAQMLKNPGVAGLAVGGVDTLSPLAVGQIPSATSGVCSAPWPGQGGAVADIQMVYQSVDAESGFPDDIHFMRCGLPNGSGGYVDATCTATSTDRYVVLAPDTSLRNIGTTTVSWHQMFSGVFPPYGNDQHPFLVWNLYRVDADGALHQLGASGAKHAFNTINKTCNCSDHKNSYPTCEDSYSNYSNDIAANQMPNFLGPRSEIIPATGQWGRCASVFDKNCVGALDSDGGAQNDFQYRLRVREDQIAAASQSGASYYFEYAYVIRDQANIYDAMGYRPVSLTKIPGTAGAYLWTVDAGTFANGPVLNLWVDPANPPAGARNTELATPEGHARVAVRTKALGGGLYRYDYAVMNLDFARAVIDPAHTTEPNLHVLSTAGFSAFGLPISAGVTFSDFAFSDADDDSSNDWIVTRTATALRWQAAAGHTLNWGTLFRFSFTADRAPVAAKAALDVATAGIPGGYLAITFAPLDDAIFSDNFDGNTFRTQ